MWSVNRAADLGPRQKCARPGRDSTPELRCSTAWDVLVPRDNARNSRTHRDGYQSRLQRSLSETFPISPRRTHAKPAPPAHGFAGRPTALLDNRWKAEVAHSSPIRQLWAEMLTGPSNMSVQVRSLAVASGAIPVLRHTRIRSRRRKAVEKSAGIFTSHPASLVTCWDASRIATSDDQVLQV